jgi:hypothetical protein
MFRRELRPAPDPDVFARTLAPSPCSFAVRGQMPALPSLQPARSIVGSRDVVTWSAFILRPSDTPRTAELEAHARVVTPVIPCHPHCIAAMSPLRLCRSVAGFLGVLAGWAGVSRPVPADDADALADWGLRLICTLLYPE